MSSKKYKITKFPEVGLRLREFGESKFATIKEFADKLNMQPSSLQTYLNGYSMPGGEILKKLSLLGCDIVWLLTGETNKEKSNREAEEFWQRLKEAGITREEFDEVFPPGKYMMDINKYLEILNNKKK